MPLMRPPAVNAVVEVAPELVERYKEQGWTIVSATVRTEPARRRGRPKKQD